MTKPLSLNTRPFDFAAIGLSGLCLVHCIGLPILTLFLPVLGALSEAEWVHRLLVLLAVPVSLLVIWKHVHQSSGHFFVPLIILAGLACLIAGAFVEAFHDFETHLTLVGVLLIGAGHICRLAFHRI